MKQESKHPSPITFAKKSEMPYCTLALGTTEWNETGTWRYLRPRYVERVPACQYACPTSNDIEAWIRLFEAGKLAEAWEAATLENPFPGIMGRVCFHPCMEGCNRRELGGSVNIQMCERTLADAMGKELPPAKAFFPASGKKVAVIGAGPAGLACAYHLSRLGHAIEIFERMPEAGGMLRYGIPEYRLPNDALDREIKRLEGMGIKFNLGKPVKSAADMQTMRQDYAAVFMAIGAYKSKAMGVPDEKAPGVMAGLEFLRKVVEGKAPALGKKVLVVGGGNTAIDAARTARRLGAEVALAYRRSRAEMPAFEEEVRQAEEEGVKIEILLSPKRVVTAGGKATGLECLKMKLGDPDESGRRQPVPIEGSETVIAADTILTAIGEEIETAIVPSALPIERGAIKTRPGGRTEWNTVFAGGDFIAQPRTVVNALAAGKRSAIAIDCVLRGEQFDSVFDRIRVADTDSVLMSRYLQIRTGQPPKAATTSELERLNKVVTFSDLNPNYFQRSEPAAYPMLSAEERLSNGGFAEIHQAPSEETRKAELARCFHCGRCTECDNCYVYCPDAAISKKECGFEIDYYFCKGCGVCLKECPRAAMEMIEEPTEI
ncbi:MAG TPA: NAD(P)-binding protein [bacterium]|nr:NAD(P)-binding protein [bacterium]